MASPYSETNASSVVDLIWTWFQQALFYVNVLTKWIYQAANNFFNKLTDLSWTNEFFKKIIQYF